MTAPTTHPYALTRMGTLLAPEPGLSTEAGGVLNPTVYQAGGRTYLMYRSVADVPENFSRLALAELVWEGGQMTAKRLGRFALEPAAPYELLTPDGEPGVALGGGCEDPRVTAIDGTLYLCYTAYGQDRNARIGLAKSTDGLNWTRMGLARFTLHLAETADGVVPVDLNHVDNKDAMLFPERINGRYAMLHRPMFREKLAASYQPRQSIWISYSDDLIHWDSHALVAAPEHPWERLKLGGGTQPERVADGWLIIYHGVDGDRDSDPNRRYSAGAMILDAENPAVVRYRSPQPILTPDAAEERVGVVNNVVFPTGLWKSPDGKDWLVAYGMADRAIGWARTPVVGA